MQQVSITSYALLRERNFALLFVGQSVSLLGDALVPVALAFAVLDVTGSVASLGIVLAAGYGPLSLLLLVGGVWSDRLPRQLVMLCADSVRFGAQGATALLLLLGGATVLNLALLQALYGAATAFFNPASTGLVPQMVDAAQLQGANALLSLSRSGASLIGPVVAGTIVAVTSPGWVFALDAASFGVSFASLLALRVGRAARPAAADFVGELKEGWRVFSGTTWLWVSVAFFSLYFFCVLAPFFVLGPAIARRSLGGAGAWAAILAAGGLGNIAGGLFALRVTPRRPLFVSYVLCFAVVAAVALLGVRAPTAAIAAAFGLGRLAMAFFGAVWITVLQQNVPPDAVARVSAYDWLGSVAFFPAGLALAGVVGAVVGPGRTLVGSAAAFGLLVCAVLAVPEIRSLRANDGVALQELGELDRRPLR